ncbi:hypothetical protein, conserved [Plasmodium gonderi]|uniref:Uncharacterized protein n=1 Tax=Plasmodium gonderi TaxID=77519 RepID=A0A1Y1JG55_PLAGO|nr:hypothetical protein, conserved [Plasmodium gonderi]GAW81501.1 hypothetical protein, conserved [Plasmodium gonderi]
MKSGRVFFLLLCCMYEVWLAHKFVNGKYISSKGNKLKMEKIFKRGSHSPFLIDKTQEGFIKHSVFQNRNKKNIPNTLLHFTDGTNITTLCKISILLNKEQNGLTPFSILLYKQESTKSKEFLKKDNNINKRNRKKTFFKLCAKMPVVTINKKLYPKEYSTDYENVLRKFDVTYINYKTRLRSKKEIDIKSIDDLYGQIYDRDILKKQFYFFLYHDDINTCYRVLNENRNVLTREESFKILNSLPYIFVNHLNYVYPTKENVDIVLSKLLKTYIFQYANDKNIDFLNFKYKYNELNEYCQQLERDFQKEQTQVHDKEELSKENMLNPNEKNQKGIDRTDERAIYDDGSNTNYEQKYQHMSYDYRIIESTNKYKELMERFRKYPENIKLQKVQLLYTKILSMKGNKIFEAFRKHESVKKNEARKIYRNAKLSIDVNKLTPYVNEPIKYDKEEKKKINELFHKYVEEKDLINAALIIRKYTNLIDTRDEKSQEIMKKFLRLHEYIYKCNKYNEKELAHLRMIYYSTVQKSRVIRKICEVGMWQQGENVTHKEVYEKQLNRYLQQREALRDERMEQKNIDMDEIRDFSSAYPMEWLPVLYKDLFEQIEKEKTLKDSEKKNTLSRKRDSIKKLFSTSIAEKGTNNDTSSDFPLNEKGNNKGIPHDLLNVKNELKIGKNILNYKKKKLGKNRRKKEGGKASKRSQEAKSSNSSDDTKEEDA